MEGYEAIQDGQYEPEKKSRYAPISTAGYVGILLLMAIPIVGFVVALVWAFGGTGHIEKRNLARASLILMLISCILGFVSFHVISHVVSRKIESFVQESGLAEYADLLGTDSGLEDYSGLLGIDSKNIEDLDSLSDLGQLSDLLGIISNEDISGVDISDVDSDMIKEYSDLLQELLGQDADEESLNELIKSVTEILQEQE